MTDRIDFVRRRVDAPRKSGDGTHRETWAIIARKRRLQIEGGTQEGMHADNNVLDVTAKKNRVDRKAGVADDTGDGAASAASVGAATAKFKGRGDNGEDGAMAAVEDAEERKTRGKADRKKKKTKAAGAKNDGAEQAREADEPSVASDADDAPRTPSDPAQQPGEGSMGDIAEGRTADESSRRIMRAAGAGAAAAADESPGERASESAPRANEERLAQHLRKGEKNEAEAAMLLNDPDAPGPPVLVNDPLHDESLPAAHASPPLPLHRTYPATLSLILLLHVVFFRQWNRRRHKRDVAASYRVIVRRRLFHRAVGAALSHPAADPPPYPSSSSSSSSPSASTLPLVGGRTSATTMWGRMTSRVSVPRLLVPAADAARRALAALTAGSLSGLPLLAYASHILWQCRALETLYGSPPPVGIYRGDSSTLFSAWAYPLVLLALWSTALLLEIGATHHLLVVTADHSTIVPSGAGGSSSSRGGSSVARRQLLDRSFCGCASLAVSLVVVFEDHYPRVALDVLPFLPSSSTSFLSRWFDPEVSHILCVTTLLVLSWRFHPLAGVLSGALSGLLWSAGLTSWLGRPYWARCLAATVGVACALSWKAEGGRTARELLPCVDYVGFCDDADGDGGGGGPATATRAGGRARRGRTGGSNGPSGSGVGRGDDVTSRESGEGRGVAARNSRSLGDDDDRVAEAVWEDDDVENRPLLSGRGALSDAASGVVDRMRNGGGRASASSDAMRHRMPLMPMDSGALGGDAEETESGRVSSGLSRRR